MRLLLDYDPDISARDRDDETVLYRASGLGRTQEVELLLDSGAPIEDRQNSMTALMIASKNRRAQTMRLLLERGAKIDSVLPETGYDCLCLAVAGNNTWDCSRFQLEWTIRSLVEYGAEVDGNTSKAPPLSLALREDSIFVFATVEALLDSGADIEKTDLAGCTPLETWISKSSWYDTSVLHLLLKRHVNVNRINEQGRSPLAQVCAAAEWHSLDVRISVIQKLIEYESDVNQADSDGNTAAMIICMNPTLSELQKYILIRLLLKNGAKTWLENRNRETLLIKAMRHFVLGTKERRQVLESILNKSEISWPTRDIMTEALGLLHVTASNFIIVI